jgi:hypothetical protein
LRYKHYPAFRRDRVNQPGYTKDYGTGMSDLNGYSEGGYSDYFHQPGEYGGTSSFYNTQASTTNSDPLGGSKGDILLSLRDQSGLIIY